MSGGTTIFSKICRRKIAKVQVNTEDKVLKIIRLQFVQETREIVKFKTLNRTSLSCLWPEILAFEKHIFRRQCAKLFPATVVNKLVGVGGHRELKGVEEWG